MTLLEVMREAGLPETMLALSFVTYEDGAYNLRRMTTPEFVCDARFHIHGLAAAMSGPESSVVHTAFTTDPQQLALELRRVLGPRLELATVVAHDAQFAGLILERKFSINPRFVVCTRFMANGVNADGLAHGDLASVARHFGLGGVPDQPCAQGVRDLDVRQVEALRRASVADARLVLDLARTLMPRLPGGAQEIRAIDHTIKMFSERGLRLDVAGAERLRAQVEALLAEEGRNDAGSLVQTAARLRSLIAVARATGGLVPVQLEYHRAHTGRWQAAGGVNLQNLPHRAGGLAAQVRELLLPRDGHVFIVVDASQIEPRVLAWLAGEDQLLAAFADTERDIYCEFATSVYARLVRKPLKDDPENFALELKALRGVGKEAVVALGYRMGAKRFYERVVATPAGALLVSTGLFTPTTAQTTVMRYRSTYPAIPALWERLEGALRATLRDGGEHAPYRLDGTVVVVSLPSGREIHYRGMALKHGTRMVRMGVDDDGIPVSVPSAGEWLTDATGAEVHGGPLAENLVQAMARDLLAGAVLRLEDLGHRVVLHVHDEIVLEVPAAKAQAALEDAKRELSRDPGWDPDRGPLPLRAEGRPATTYGK